MKASCESLLELLVLMGQPVVQSWVVEAVPSSMRICLRDSSISTLRLKSHQARMTDKSEYLQHRPRGVQ